MIYLICYDVMDNRRRNHIVRVLEGWGLRVQGSVFECHLTASEQRRLEARLSDLLITGVDMLRFYPLCAKDISLFEFSGTGDRPQSAPSCILV